MKKLVLGLTLLVSGLTQAANYYGIKFKIDKDGEPIEAQAEGI